MSYRVHLGLIFRNTKALNTTALLGPECKFHNQQLSVKNCINPLKKNKNKTWFTQTFDELSVHRKQICMVHLCPHTSPPPQQHRCLCVCERESECVFMQLCISLHLPRLHQRNVHEPSHTCTCLSHHEDTLTQTHTPLQMYDLVLIKLQSTLSIPCTVYDFLVFIFSVWKLTDIRMTALTGRSQRHWSYTWHWSQTHLLNVINCTMTHFFPYLLPQRLLCSPWPATFSHPLSSPKACWLKHGGRWGT